MFDVALVWGAHGDSCHRLQLSVVSYQLSCFSIGALPAA